MIWIIIGLIILIPIPNINIIPNFLGYLAMVYGLMQIKHLHNRFTLSIYPLALHFIYSFLTFIDNILYLLKIDKNIITTLYQNKFLEIFLNSFNGRYSIIYAIFALFFYIGLQETANRLNYHSLAKQASNLLFLILFFLGITIIPYIRVLPNTIYYIITYVIIIFEIIVVFTANKIIR